MVKYKIMASVCNVVEIPENPPDILNYDLADGESLEKFRKDMDLYLLGQKQKNAEADLQDKIKIEVEEAEADFSGNYDDKSKEELLEELKKVILYPKIEKIKSQKVSSPEKNKTENIPKKAKPEPVRKVKKSSGQRKINEKYSREKCMETYDPSVCGVRKSTEWWNQCGGEIGENGFVCNKCDKLYHQKSHWWRCGHMEVWGEYSLSTDPEIWGEKHGKWTTKPSQNWLVSGDLQDNRDEEFQQAFPIEVACVDESSEEEEQ